MRKILPILFCLFVFSVSASFAATPPPREVLFPVQSIALTYNLKSGSLRVEAVHPSNNWEIDYVRMMTVSLNSQIVSTLNYYHQTSAQGFSENVSLKAQVGDVITVELFTTDGGSSSQELTVAEPEIAQPDQSADTGTTN